MGINLKDYVPDVEDLFTFEEAEQLFIAAGYTKKEHQRDGFKKVNITSAMLSSNQQTLNTQGSVALVKCKHFEMTIEQPTTTHFTSASITIVGNQNINQYIDNMPKGVA